MASAAVYRTRSGREIHQPTWYDDPQRPVDDNGEDSNEDDVAPENVDPSTVNPQYGHEDSGESSGDDEEDSDTYDEGDGFVAADHEPVEQSDSSSTDAEPEESSSSEEVQAEVPHGAQVQYSESSDESSGMDDDSSE